MVKDSEYLTVVVLPLWYRYLAPIMLGAVLLSSGCDDKKASTPAEVSYGSCADAPGPVARGEPGYRAGLDLDGDGVACE